MKAQYSSRFMNESKITGNMNGKYISFILESQIKKMLTRFILKDSGSLISKNANKTMLMIQ